MYFVLRTTKGRQVSQYALDRETPFDNAGAAQSYAVKRAEENTASEFLVARVNVSYTGVVKVEAKNIE